jgi:hypothetical protein
MRVSIPLRLPSLANCRMHWRRLARLKQTQRAATRAALQGLTLPDLPLRVTITRVGPRRLDDDNLASAAKYVRDAIAEAVGVDDGSALYEWRYAQRVGKYGVEVEVVGHE